MQKVPDNTGTYMMPDTWDLGPPIAKLYGLLVDPNSIPRAARASYRVHPAGFRLLLRYLPWGDFIKLPDDRFFHAFKSDTDFMASSLTTHDMDILWKAVYDERTLLRPANGTRKGAGSLLRAANGIHDNGMELLRASE